MLEFIWQTLEPRQFLGEHRHALPPRARHPGDVGAPEHPRGAEGVKAAVQMLMKAAERIGVLGVAHLTGRLDRDIRVFGERQQLRLESIGGLAHAGARHAHVIDDQFEARVTRGDLADGRQKHRSSQRHRHPRALGGRPQPVEGSIGEPRLWVPLVGIKAQPDHARPLFPMGDEVAPLGVIEIEPAHDAKAVGIFPHCFLGQLVRIRVPQHRVDQRAVDGTLIHRSDRLLRRVRLLAMVR